MNEFEQLINEINENISIVTNKMLDAAKIMDECKSKLDELNRQKQLLQGLTTYLDREY